MPDGFKQMPRAVQIDAVALVKIRLRLAGDDGGEMEDEIGPGGDEQLPPRRERKGR